jgi:hypothetical protein
MLVIDKDMNNNLKDPEEKSSTSYGAGTKDMSARLSYTKTHKLITALYMVTDIIDKEEPIRNKLRMLGVEIISDIVVASKSVLDVGKIDQVMSFLNIASAMNFISEMNCSILVKEFLELKLSIQECANVKPKWLEKFLEDSPLEGWSKTGVDKFIPPPPKGYSSRGELNSKGHTSMYKGHTRIGVQKGSTLLKALSDKTQSMSDSNFVNNKDSFEMLKKQRRYDIVNVIKNNNGNATIKDIKDKMGNGTHNSPICSEKTLQRELLSMVKDGVLYKTGEKRWTKYSLLTS